MEDLQPLTDIYELRRLVTKLSNIIFSIHGHDRLKLFDAILALLTVKVYDEITNASDLKLPKLIKQEDTVLQENFQSLYQSVIEHLHLPLADFQPSINVEALRTGLEVLSPYSFSPKMDSQVEMLGTFYQEIVSSTFRGSLGAYFTPKPVVDFAISLCQPLEDDSILDMCCGSGTFLMGTYDSLMRSRKLYSNTLSIYGCDIQGRMVLTTALNCIIRGISNPSLIQGNALEIDLHKWHSLDHRVPKEGFSLIVGNPPFAGFESTRYLPYSAAKLTRVNKVIPFIAKTLQLLRPNGRAVLVIPISVLNGEAKQFTELRRWLYSEAEPTEIISLPRHAFAHTDTGIEGALFFFKRRSNDSVQSYTFFKTLASMGYDRRGRSVSTSDTEETLEQWRQGNIDDGCWIETVELQYLDRWDPAWLKEYGNGSTEIDETIYVPLTKVCTIVKRQLREVDIRHASLYQYFEVRDTDINTGEILHIHIVKGQELHGKIRLRVPVEEGDVLLPNHRDSLIAKTARETGRSAVLVTNSERDCITTNRFTVLKPVIDPRLLVFVLNTRLVRNQLALHARGSASFDIRDKVLYKIWIPRAMVEDGTVQVKILALIENRKRLQAQIEKVDSSLRVLSEGSK